MAIGSDPSHTDHLLETSFQRAYAAYDNDKYAVMMELNKLLMSPKLRTDYAAGCHLIVAWEEALDANYPRRFEHHLKEARRFHGHLVEGNPRNGSQ